MRTAPFVSWSRRVVDELQSSPRRVWSTTFLLATVLSGLWGLAGAPLSGPDEPAHVIRAVALDHGDLTGREPTGRLERALRPVDDSVRVVHAPEIYRSVSKPPCFARQQGVAACLNFEGSSRDAPVLTYAARQPPAYYAVVGVVSWFVPAGSLTVYAMRFLGALIAGAFIATAITTVRRSAAPSVLAAGVLLAITPMVLFMSSVVNPSGPEIAASVAVWVCGLALVSSTRGHVDNRLVTAVGIAGCVLALSRQLGPLWLALVAIFVACFANRTALRPLARSGWARLWGALILVSSGFQLAWDVVIRPRDATLVVRTPSRLAVIEPLAHTGEVFRWYREMIGSFGWLDTPAPVLTWLPWTAAIAFLFFVALGWATRRHAAMLLALLAAIIVAPAVIDATLYDTAGTYWQGRYILPLAVGLPIVAAFALGSIARGRQLATRRFLLIIGAVVVVAQFLAFGQNLRRYMVGYDGEIQFWKHPEWSPPLPALLLTVAFAAGLIAFVSFVLVTPAAAVRRQYEKHEKMRA